MGALTFLASRFVAGETAERALQAVRALNARGLKATLDHLGEDSRTREQAAAAADEYVELLRRIAQARADANVSLKLTQLGLAVDESLCRDNLLRVVEEAARLGNFVRIDMEGSAWTQKTLDLFYALHDRHPNVGIVLQSMLRRSEADCRQAAARRVRVRLVKGAYKEPPTLAFPDKEGVNAAYDRCARILAGAPSPAFGSHDEERLDFASRACESAGLGRKDYEIQMLYGLRRRRWGELAAQGHVVRVYVPYGRHWLPYFYRRLRERKENVLFVLKGLFS